MRKHRLLWGFPQHFTALTTGGTFRTASAARGTRRQQSGQHQKNEGFHSVMKTQKPHERQSKRSPLGLYGAGCRTRTDDLIITNELLYQLS
jgi:hypothetical protein